MSRARFAAAGWLLAASALPLHAQAPNQLPSSAPLPPVQGQDQAPAPDTSVPPYEPQLDRLAELMGALAYLRDLCGKGDAPEWRARMSALLEAEAPSPARRARLAGAYNRGFNGYETTYRICTPSADLAVLRFLDEGKRLTQDLATRFGGG